MMQLLPILEECRNGKPLIQSIIDLRRELDEIKQINIQYEAYIKSLKHDLSENTHNVLVLEANEIKINARWKETARLLSRCQDELVRVKNKPMNTQANKIK